MRVVSAVETFPGSVHEAETVWYAASRWASWIDGLARVQSVEEPWPEVGGSVNWESGPAGRGQVVERVLSYEPLKGQTVEVADDTIEGSQSVQFTPADKGVEVELTLSYKIKRRSIVTPLIDVLFIRRAFATSLRTTLERFGLELEAARRSGVG